MLTYSACLRAASQTLQSAGIEAAHYDARQLLLHAGHLTPSELVLREPEPMPTQLYRIYQTLIDRRKAREPLQHIIGRAGFFGLDLICDKRALIPRADSETCIELALTYLDADKHHRICDLGTGSGALLLALLSQSENWTGTGLDISASATALARENLSQLGLMQRAKIDQKSWTDWTGWGECDLIISNPPYIRAEDIALLEAEVRVFDPRLALDGGDDGLTAYKDIIARAGQKMRKGSVLVLEHGYDQSDAVKACLKKSGFYNVRHAKDVAGKPRAIAACK